MASQTSAAADERCPVPPVTPTIGTCLDKRERSFLPRWLLTGSIVVSCMLHAAAVAAMLSYSATSSDYGVLSQQTDAISVEMTASAVVDAIDAPATVATAAAAPTATQEGNPLPSSAPAVPVTEVKEATAEEPVVETIKAREPTPNVVDPVEEPLDVLRGSAEASDQIAEKEAELTEEERKEAAKEEKVETKEEKEQQQAAAQVSGGATARSSAQAESPARVSGSRGSILSYAASIRAKVARNKPAGLGRRGEVRVSFGVTPSGDLSYATLAQSSGNAQLDETAIEAVRRSAPFAPPPADASPAQLRFSIPFYFR